MILVRCRTDSQKVAYNTSKFHDEDALRRDVETKLVRIFRSLEPKDFLFRQYVQPS